MRTFKKLCLVSGGVLIMVMGFGLSWALSTVHTVAGLKIGGYAALLFTAGACAYILVAFAWPKDRPNPRDRGY
jgi:hypothetical protein